MCDAFSDSHDVTLLCIKGESEDFSIFKRYGVEPRFSIVFSPGLVNRLFRKISLLFFTWRLIRKIRPDIIYARDLPSAFLASVLHCPVVVELHSAPIGAKSKQLLARLLKQKNLLRIVSISNALALHIKSEYGIPDGKMLVVHDGASVDVNPVIKARQTSINRRFQVGYFGSLNIGKGVETVIDLAGITPWADFNIIGGESAEISWWQEQKVIGENVHFRGYLEHSQIAEKLHSMDVVLLPNQHHVRPHGNVGDIGSWTSPLKMFEYMASGIPIISSSIEVLKEVLVDGQNALLCHPTDLKEWQAALSLLKNDPLKGRLIADTARREFEEKYTWQSRAEFVLSGITESQPRN